MNLSRKSLDFIEKNVITELGIKEITDNNIQQIIDYILDNFEIPLAQAKECGEEIDEELLKRAAAVITEITSN